MIWRRSGVACLMLLATLAGTGCFRSQSVRQAPAPAAVSTVPAPASHQVQRNETLYGIARRYGLDFRELARWNGIESPYTIYPRQILLLGAPGSAAKVATQRAQGPRRAGQAQTAPLSSRPAATGSNPVAASPPNARPSPGPAQASAAVSPPATASPARPAAAGGWRWPTEGKVIRGFVANDPGRQGIKIAGEAGQPVLAARAGQVVYSGAGLVGYGELVIVKHDGGYLTAYGHNQRRLVQEGAQVQAGQPIAELGRSGTDREMLHFEIRVAGKPVDPLPLLPR